MRSVPRVLALALVLAAGCRDLPTAADAPAPAFARAAARPTRAVLVEVVHGGTTLATLPALHHQSRNSEWVNFGAGSPRSDVLVTGSGRVQFAAGRTQAAGTLTIPVAGGTLVIDLAQFDGATVSPFEPDAIGPGGGCIVARATLVLGQQGAIPIEVELEWGTHGH
jgi:hypothetical protein